MNDNAPPLTSQLVLIGGGHAHVHLIKMMGMPPYKKTLTEHGISVTLITRDVNTPYSGMLPGYLAGFYSFEDIHLDLRKLCSFAGVQLIHASACGIIVDSDTDTDTPKKMCSGRIQISCSSEQGDLSTAKNRPDVRFDCLSIDIGSSPSSSFVSNCNDPRDNEGLKINDDNAVAMITPVKPISNFAERYHQLMQRLEQHYAAQKDTDDDDPFTLLIVGGGAGGIELCLSVEHKLKSIFGAAASNNQENSKNRSRYKVILATKGSTVLAGHNARVQNIFHRILKERGIDVRFDAEVVGITTQQPDCPYQNGDFSKSRRIQKLAQLAPSDKNPQTNKQQSIPFDDCLWCTSAGAASWLRDSTPFQTDERGFLQTDDYLQCIHHRGIFAAGDCATMLNHSRPKAGVFAVRAGPPLLRNIMSYLTNRKMHVYKPQRAFLSLISTGDRYAVASRGSLIAWEGAYLWTLKDYIDRKWMRMYQDLPNMLKDNEANLRKKVPASIVSSRGSEVAAAFVASSMRCGGCGAKVGASTLTRVLKAVHQRAERNYRNNFMNGKINGHNGDNNDNNHATSMMIPIEHDDAAIIPITSNQAGGAMIHTIDFFRSFISDPFIFGKIAAVHALSDCHAMGAEPRTALALAVVPYAATESITESTLIAMLSGASDVLTAERCQLVGGHTCEGAELALGFAVHGFIANCCNPRQAQNNANILRKRGCRVGDRLILTKPIGTGALFAADMRAKSRAVCVQEALESMMISNDVASQVAMKMNLNSDAVVHACTDVTGFGLMGHLLEMLVANDDDNNTNNGEDDDSIQSVGCRLNLHDIPFLQGAMEASAAQIFSSLQPENYKHAHHQVSNHKEAIRLDSVRYPLLFDPQTAGGLLFSVDCAHARQFMKLLSVAGVPVVADIGEVVSYEAAKTEGGVCSRTSRKRVFVDCGGDDS